MPRHYLEASRPLLVIALATVILYASIAVVARDPNDYYNPLIGGVQIYTVWSDGYMICSTGFPAYYYEPPTAPDRPGYYVFGLVTASHCGEKRFLVYQPDTSSPSYYIGYIQIDPGHPRLSDSAFIKTEDSYVSDPTTVSAEVLYYNDVIPILGYVSIDALEPYETYLYKTGRTTGTTYGLYVGVGQFQAEGPFGENIVIEHGIEALYQSDNGDSGGTVFIVDRFDREFYAWVVGIHNGVAVLDYGAIQIEVRVSSPYNDTLADLGVSAYG